MRIDTELLYLPLTISSYKHKEGALMKKRNNQVIFFSIVFTVLSLLLPANSFVSGEQIESDSLIKHDPIIIESDDNFTTVNGVSKGSGTIKDPYIISGLYIDASVEKFGIYIKSTTSYFTIVDCLIQGASDSTGDYNEGSTNSYRGITLHNVKNAFIMDNILYDNFKDDIFLYSSSNCVIRSNICASSHGHNNILINGSPDNIIEGNICDPLEIQRGNYTVRYPKSNGIKVEYNSADLIIRNNTANNHAVTGISIDNKDNDDCIVENNTANYNENGIEVSGNNVIVTSNSCLFNDRYGIKIEDVRNGIIEDNFCHGNEKDGIMGTQPNGFDHSTLIVYNKCSGNKGNGIVLHGYDYEIRNNLIIDNEESGINIREKDNLVHDNVIRDNMQFGIDIDILFGNVGSSSGNLIYRNNFIDNGDGASAQGQDEDNGNKWNTNSIGNYWNDWTEPDANSDGIVDNPYDLISDHDISDLLPATKPFNIKVTKPQTNGNNNPDDGHVPDDDEDDVHDTDWNEETNNPPLYGVINLSDLDIREGEEFELTISAVDPDEGKGDQLQYEWYIDGIGNIGEGETIEIELPEGDYTILVKITDEYGEEIIVTKDITVRGEEEKWKFPILPVFIGMVIVILVLLIIGGFFLKKRNQPENAKNDLEIPINEVMDGVGMIGSKPSGPSTSKIPLVTGRDDHISVRSGRVTNVITTVNTPITKMEVEEMKMEIMGNKRIHPDDKRRELLILLESKKDELHADSYREARSILSDNTN